MRPPRVRGSTIRKTIGLEVRYLMVEKKVFLNQSHKKIAKDLMRSTKSVGRVLRKFYRGQSLVPNFKGPSPKLTRHDAKMIINLLRKRPDLFIKHEMVELVEEYCGKRVTPDQLYRLLKRYKVTYKQLTLVAAQRSEVECQRHLDFVKALGRRAWFFMDETAHGRRDRCRGWWFKGLRATARRKLSRLFTIMGMTTIGADGVVLTRYIKGSIDGTLWLEYVVDVLARLPRGAVFVIDNAPVHMRFLREAEQIAEEVFGIAIVSLPCYAPHLQPIEEFFGCLKAHLVRNRDILLKHDIAYGTDTVEARVHKLIDAERNLTLDYRRLIERHGYACL